MSLFTRAVPADKIDKAVGHAVKWLATEHNFFTELKKDLGRLRQDLVTAQPQLTVADIKKVFKDFKFIGKSERRANNYEHQVEESLETYAETVRLQGTLNDIAHLRERIHTEAADLVRAASFYEGEIKNLLVHLRDNIQEHHFAQAQAVVMEIEHRIDEAEKWLAALVQDLNLARNFRRTASEGFGYANSAIAKEEEARQYHNPSGYVAAGDLFAQALRWNDAGRCYELALEIRSSVLNDEIIHLTLPFQENFLRAFAARHNWPLAVKYGIEWALRVTHTHQHRISKIASLVQVLTQNGLEKKKAWGMVGDEVLKYNSSSFGVIESYQVALYCYTQAKDSMRKRMCRRWLDGHLVAGQAQR